MNHPISRAKAYLLLIGCTFIAGCSFQVPNEGDVFAKSSVGGQTSGGYANTSSGGSTISTAGSSAQSGGSSSLVTSGGSTTGGAGGTSATASGGTAGASVGGAPVGGGGSGTTLSGGTLAIGGSAPGQTGGSSSSAGGSSAGSSTLGGGATSGGSVATGGSLTATGGGGVTTGGGGGGNTGGTLGTGGAPTGGKSAIGGAATGGAATGGAATGGAATGGVATGGKPATGGAATGGAATGGAATGGAPPQVILQYAFEDGSGTTATDSTTNHNDGTLSNVSWSLTGRNGGAANYAATNSQITVPSGLLGTSQSLTIAAWVNLSANTAENRLFYFGTSDSTSYLTLTLNNSVNGISVRFKSATGTEQVLTTPTQIPLGVWKHITVSVSNVGATLYVDGKIVARDKTLVMDPTTLGTPMTNFVGSSPTAGQSFQGLIDEFYVYNGVLPLSDVRQLAWPKTDYSIYHLDEGTGTSTVDSSDRAINGTLVGGTTWVQSPFGTGVNLLNNPAVTPAQQYVDLGDGLVSDCGLNLTLSGWFNITTNTTDAPLFEFAKDTINVVNITSYSTTATPPSAVFSFDFRNSGTDHIVRARPYSGWTIGTWTHVAAIRSGTDGRPVAIYQNGLKVYTGSTNTGALFSSWGTTVLNALGKSSTDTIPGFDGAIDEVLVSCRAYTDDEVKQLAYLPPPN